MKVYTTNYANQSPFPHRLSPFDFRTETVLPFVPGSLCIKKGLPSGSPQLVKKAQNIWAFLHILVGNEEQIWYNKSKEKRGEKYADRTEKTSLEVEVDEDAVEECAEIFDALGFTLDDGINMFLRQCMKDHGLPFTLHL